MSRKRENIVRRLLATAVVVVGLAVVTPTNNTMAAQTTFYKYSTCFEPPSGSLQFRRSTASYPCQSTHAFGADSNLRSAGTGDIFHDTVYLGTAQLSTTNTHALWNRWTVAVNICVGKDYFVTRNSMPSGGYINTNGQTTGLMSYRASTCINN